VNRQDASNCCNMEPSLARIILIVSRQRAQGRCFSDLRHPEAYKTCFTDQARYEKRSSTTKGLLLGVCFVAEDPKTGEHLRKIFS
jgi:hypothetical protein